MRRLRIAKQFTHRQSQNQTIDDRHAFGPPAFGRVGDERVDFREPIDRRTGEAGCEGSHVVWRWLGVGPLQFKERPRRLLHVDFPDFPLIENLESRLSRPAAAVFFHARPRLSPRRATRAAISIAAFAASQPLLDGPSPARSSASSAELVVRTPNAIGTPVAPAASVRPCATAEAMKSKCGVAPLIRHPRHTIAS